MCRGFEAIGKFFIFTVVFFVTALCCMSETVVCGGSETLKSTSSMTDGKADWLAQIQKDIAMSEYHVRKVNRIKNNQIFGAKWQATNRAHNLRTYYTPSGPMVIPRKGDSANWRWGLELMDAPPVMQERVTENRFEYHRKGGVIEWYVNDPQGLEQGFMITEKLEGEKKIVLKLALLGDLQPEMKPSGKSIEFKSKIGRAVINYGHLKAWDVTGKELPSKMNLAREADGRRYISLSIDATGACYPLTIDPLATKASWKDEIDQREAMFGFSVSNAGDVNGDGFSDVIVGAPEYNNAKSDEGGAFVYLGSSTGLSQSPDWSKEGNRLNARFGHSVSSAGDVNGDGYHDVIVGAKYYSNGQLNEGAAFVYYGSSSGLSESADWHYEGDIEQMSFGHSVSTAGDVNNDGYSDIIIGAPYYSNGESNEGAAFVFLGSSSGLSTSPDWSFESNEEFFNYGWSVSTAGDVNGDGYSDIIVGEQWYENGQEKEGRAYVYLGSAAGLSSSPSWTAEGNQQEAYFGRSVSSAGDVNGDGFDEILVGSPFFDNGEQSEGRVSLYYGSESGPQEFPEWTSESDVEYAFYGHSVSPAGDLNNDGFSDILVGADGYEAEKSEEGAVFLYLGSASGLTISSEWSVEGDRNYSGFGFSVSGAGDVNGDGFGDVIIGADSYTHGENSEGGAFLFRGISSGLSISPSWTAESDQQDAGFGESVSSAGDVNNDGFSDIIIGAPGYDNGESNEGRAFVYFGSEKGISVSSPWSAEGDQKDARFGESVSSAGDVNNDGFDDIIIGAPGYDNGEKDEGRAFVFLGGASGPTTGTADWTAESDQPNAHFGGSASSAGDVNNDGFDDVIAGAADYDNGQSGEGMAFVYLGGPSGLKEGNADWTAESNQAQAGFGYSVSTTGDVNGDNFCDVIIGAPYYNNGEESEGRAFVYHGSETGLPSTPEWSAEIDKAESAFGFCVSTAGDVNGDNFSDVIIGAKFFSHNQTSEGAAFVYHGSEDGLTSGAINWSEQSNQAGAGFGHSVSNAGDVNNDGFSDVLVGAPDYNDGEPGEGRAYLYLGSSSGLSASPNWTAESNQPGAGFGSSVSGAGDVTGNGYSAVIIGSNMYDATVTTGNSKEVKDKNFDANQGRAFLYYSIREPEPSPSASWYIY